MSTHPRRIRHRYQTLVQGQHLAHPRSVPHSSGSPGIFAGGSYGTLGGSPGLRRCVVAGQAGGVPLRVPLSDRQKGARAGLDRSVATLGRSSCLTRRLGRVEDVAEDLEEVSQLRREPRDATYECVGLRWAR